MHALSPNRGRHNGSAMNPAVYYLPLQACSKSQGCQAGAVSGHQVQGRCMPLYVQPYLLQHHVYIRCALMVAINSNNRQRQAPASRHVVCDSVKVVETTRCSSCGAGFQCVAFLVPCKLCSGLLSSRADHPSRNV